MPQDERGGVNWCSDTYPAPVRQNEKQAAGRVTDSPPLTGQKRSGVFQKGSRSA